MNHVSGFEIFTNLFILLLLYLFDTEKIGVIKRFLRVLIPFLIY